MFNKILYFIVIALIIFLAVGLLLPRQVHVERSIEINRPPATVFSVLNSYRSFAAWSPWADRDPNTVYEFSGPETGAGARLSWSGDPRQVGAGWQEITESRPYSLIRMHLEFDQQGKASSYFQLTPTADGTWITWGFDTDLEEGQGWLGALLARYFGLFFDTWIGTDYESGLSRLKAYLEQLPSADFSGLDVEIINAEAVDILYVDSDATLRSPNLTESLATGYRDITTYMAERDIERAAQPMAITQIRESGGYEVLAAIPVNLPDTGAETEPAPARPAAAGATAEVAQGEETPPYAGDTAAPTPAPRVQIGQSPSGRAVRVIHRGPYDRMGPTYEKLAAWMAAHGVAEGDVSWEQYISDPGETPPDELITHIYFRIGDEN